MHCNCNNYIFQIRHKKTAHSIYWLYTSSSGLNYRSLLAIDLFCILNTFSLCVYVSFCYFLNSWCCVPSLACVLNPYKFIAITRFKFCFCSVIKVENNIQCSLFKYIFYDVDWPYAFLRISKKCILFIAICLSIKYRIIFRHTKIATRKMRLQRISNKWPRQIHVWIYIQWSY